MSVESDCSKASSQLPLRVWVIVNPTSGGGRGERVVEKVTTAIRKKVLLNPSNIVELSISDLIRQPPPVCFPQLPETPCAVIVIRTTASGESSMIAAEVCKKFVHASMGYFSCDRQCNDVILAIGGDGSLSEVVDGLCRGTLEVARGRKVLGGTDGLTEATVLSRFMPRIVYLPSGTGADFARLGFNCQSVDDVTCVLNGLLPCEESSSCNSGNTGSNGNTNSGSSARFQSCRVDIGSVMYPRSGNRRYFVNECSVGMSSDVIIKSERYKKMWFRHLGGLIIFFIAAIVALVQMKPRPMRVRRLPCATTEKHSSTTTGVPCPSGKDGRVLRLSPAEIRADLEIENRWVDFPASTIAFGNGKYFGGGMMICPHGDPTDQLFAVTAWYATFWAFVLRMFGVYNGNHVKWAETTTFEGSRFEVDGAESASERLFCETDGELGEELPAIIEFMGSMNMLRPARKT